jgi:uncharacterized protein YndB with AHSA1/START domain
MSANPPTFTITRVFDAPVAVVFQAWADPDKMARWSGPKGSQTVVIDGEIAPGAELFARGEYDGEVHAHTLTRYIEIEPDRKLVWEQSFADADRNRVEPAFAPGWPVTLRTEVIFAPVGDKTRVTLSWQPVGASDDQEAVFASNLESMNGGWSGSFDRLDEVLAA